MSIRGAEAAPEFADDGRRSDGASRYGELDELIVAVGYGGLPTRTAGEGEIAGRNGVGRGGEGEGAIGRRVS